MIFDRIFSERIIANNESEAKNIRSSFSESVKIVPLGRFFCILTICGVAEVNVTTEKCLFPRISRERVQSMFPRIREFVGGVIVPFQLLQEVCK